MNYVIKLNSKLLRFYNVPSTLNIEPSQLPQSPCACLYVSCRDGWVSFQREFNNDGQQTDKNIHHSSKLN